MGAELFVSKRSHRIPKKAYSLGFILKCFPVERRSETNAANHAFSVIIERHRYCLRLYTAGRLDYDSERLILITNDGETANRLMHPRYGAKKTYRVLCTGWLTPEDKRKLRNDVQLEDGMTSPAELRIIRERPDEKTELLLTIHEGKNRQVRRMLSAVGHDTLRLQRVAIGSFELGNLKPGEWRFVNEEELEKLIK